MLKVSSKAIHGTVFSNTNFFFFLKKLNRSKVVTTVSFQIMYQMIEMSAVKTGVFNTLISYCCQSWMVPASSASRVGSLANAKNYSELVLEACIFGTVFRRDQR